MESVVVQKSEQTTIDCTKFYQFSSLLIRPFFSAKQSCVTLPITEVCIQKPKLPFYSSASSISLTPKMLLLLLSLVFSSFQS